MNFNPAFLRSIIGCLMVFLYCTLHCSFSLAQAPAGGFAAIQSAIDTARIKYPEEKVYVQFDKTDYVAGDTIWLKAWLFNASYFTPSPQSGILYIDVANSDSVVVKQFRLQVVAGVTWGDIALTKETFPEGSYTLRAYTNWLRNFGDAHFFYRRFTVAGAGSDGWLVNTQVQSFNVNGNDSIRAKLVFADAGKKPLADKPLEVKVLTGKKTLYRSAITTTHAGGSDINFTVPGKPLSVSISAEDKPSSKKMLIPLLLNRPENMDLQFMPEGGYLVAGLPARVGFKAIGEDGRGADVKGIIVNSGGQQVAAFQSLYKGMGSFNLLPVAGESYAAKINLPTGGVKTFALPAVNPAGIALAVQNRYGDDSLQVDVAATPGFLQGSSYLFIVAQSRNVVCYGAGISLDQGAVRSNISKGLFPAGIARITLFTADGKPLNERLVYIDAKDSVRVDIDTNDSTYGTRDSIAVSIGARDEDDLAVAGNFSLAVTDDELAGAGMMSRQTIASYMLLSSNLKGYVEGPGYYFQPGNPMAWQTLDNLLLTQGWAGYNWQQVFNPQPFAFAPEYELTIKGRALNILNKGIPHTSVVLFSPRPAIVMDTTADDKGQFVFNRFPALDTPMFTIQARNRRGKSFNVGINIDETEQPVFNSPASPPLLPWYVNSDTALLTLAQEKTTQQQRLTEGMTLQEVIVRSVKRVQGSQNLNGPGNADQVLDEADMEKAGKKDLLQLLTEKVPGFKQGLWPPISVTHDAGSSHPDFLLNDKEVVLVIDGINVDDFLQPAGAEIDMMQRFAYIKSYLQMFSAEDVKGIEVNYSMRYNSAYNTRYHKNGDILIDWVYIEITTRGGHGPFTKKTAGVYLYKSIPFNWPKTFYSPRYAVKDTSDHTIDLRSTIYWAPNIVTNQAGKTTVSFYAADRPTTYTILVEGTDFNGNVAVKTKKITIRKK